MIEGSECKCGKKLVPYRNVCPSCGKKMSKTEFKDNGTVLTYTTLYAVPEGFEGPIHLAMIGLDEGANLICGYEGKEELSIGNQVKVKKKGELHICELEK